VFELANDNRLLARVLVWKAWVLKWYEKVSTSPKNPVDTMRLALLLACFTLTSAFAQQPAADAYIKRCEEFQTVGRTDSVRKYAMLTRELALTDNNPAALAKADLFIGNSLLRTYPDSAYRLLKRSYDDFWQRNDTKYLTTASNMLGNYYAQKDNKTEAIRYYLQAKDYGEQYYSQHETARYPRMMVVFNHNISTVYAEVSDYKRAQAHSLEAIRLANQHGLRDLEAVALEGMGKVLMELRQMPQAEQYFKQALALFTEQNNPRRRGVALNNLANVYLIRYVNDSLRTQSLRDKDYQQARANYTEALAIAKDLKDYPSIAFRLNGLSSVCLLKKDFVASRTYLREAITYADLAQSKSAKLKALANLALNYIETDDVPNAIQTANEALTIARQINNIEVLPELYRTLQKSYSKQKDFQKALAFQKAEAVARDSLYKTTTAAQANELLTRYETEKKQQAIDLLTAQNRAKTAELRQNEAELRQAQAEVKQKNYLLFAAAAAALLLMGYAFFVVRQRTLNQRKEAAELKQRLLRAQLNPHFLFNSLNSIQRLYVEGRLTQANDFIADFAQLMRDILEKTGRTHIPLYEEIDFIEAYLSLEKRRLGDKFDYAIVMDEQVRNSDIEVPSFIIQPLAENALLHGVLPREGQRGKIDIIVEQQPDEALTITVQDNGVGYYQSMQRAGRHTSRGMELIRQRLGKRGQLLIEELRNLNQDVLGTRIRLQLSDK
jgi:tetratricopeptide (TPR) repeat protein